MWIRASLSTLIAALIVASTAVSQQQAKPAQTEPVTIDVVYDKGTTLGEYVRAIREKRGTNIVIDSGLESVRIPSVSLHRVSVPGALQWIPSTRNARERGIVLQPTRVGRDTQTVFVFTSFQEPRRIVGNDNQVKTYYQQSPDGVWRTIPPEKISEALKQAISRRLRPDAAGVFYDNESRLLTVSGTRDDILIADQVMGEFTRGQRTAAATQNLQQELQRLQSRVLELEKTVSRLADRDTTRR